MTPAKIREMAQAYQGVCECCRNTLPLDEEAFIDETETGYAWLCPFCYKVLQIIGAANKLQPYLDYLKPEAKAEEPKPKKAKASSKAEQADSAAEQILKG